MLGLDVVAIMKALKLFLAYCVPHVELDRSFLGVERERTSMARDPQCSGFPAASETFLLAVDCLLETFFC